MSLTLEVEQRLKRVDLIEFHGDGDVAWGKMAQRAYDHLKEQYPPKAAIRPDDVAKILAPVVEVDDGLAKFLSKNKLNQKYWHRDFTDLIIDRCWQSLVPDSQ